MFGKIFTGIAILCAGSWAWDLAHYAIYGGQPPSQFDAGCMAIILGTSALRGIADLLEE